MNQEKVFRFFGLFEIERKTDILAFTAFLIALASIFWQISIYFRGPVVQLFAPDAIMIHKKESVNQESLMGVVVPMSYVNTAQAGYNGVIRREIVRFLVGNTVYEHVWQQFVSTESHGDDLKIHTIHEARPFPVPALGSESHETTFSPRQKRCLDDDITCQNANFLPWEMFLEALKDVKKLRFEFESEIYNESSVCVVCIIDVNDTLRLNLIDKHWYTAQCWEGHRCELNTIDVQKKIRGFGQ